jgi:hypothetical protein
LNNWLKTWARRGGPAIAMLLPFPAFAQTVANAGTPDLSTIMQPIFALLGTVITGVLAIYVPKALAAFQAQIRLQLTDQQRATVLGAVRTAAGMIETTLDQGAMRVAHVDIANPAVRAEAVNAINAVPNAAASLNMNVDSMARMIVGAVDVSTHGVATVAIGGLPR